MWGQTPPQARQSTGQGSWDRNGTGRESFSRPDTETQQFEHAHKHVHAFKHLSRNRHSSSTENRQIHRNCETDTQRRVLRGSNRCLALGSGGLCGEFLVWSWRNVHCRMQTNLVACFSWYWHCLYLVLTFIS